MARKPKTDVDTALMPINNVDDAIDTPSMTLADVEFVDEAIEDLGVIRVRLAQAQTAEVRDGDATAGQFMVDGLDPMATFRAQIIGRAKQRTLWYENEDDGERVIVCIAMDGKTGTGDPGGDCDECPMSKWGSNRQRPACDEQHTYKMYLPDYDVEAMYTMTGRALSPGNAHRQLNTMRQSRGSFSNFEVEFSAKEMGSNARRSYVPKVRIAQAASG